MAEPLVPPPSEEEYNRGPRVQTDSSPMRQRFGPGFERIEAVVDFLNVPKDIVYNLGGASRQAFDSDLPTDERLRKGAEAGIGTLGYALAGPVLGKALGQKASQIIPEMFLGVSGPETKPLDELTDKSRRDFMKGAAATAGVAALAPEAITEALEKVPAAVKRVKPPINPIDMFAKNIKLLRDEMNAAYDAADELPENLPDDFTRRPYDEAIAEAEKLHMDLDATTEMELRELISEIGLKEIKEAADDSIEELSQALSDFRVYGEEEYIDQMIPLAEEIEKRGLLKIKDENGIDKYPYARYVVEDVKDHLAGNKTSKDIYGMSELPKTDLEMTDRASIPVEDLVKGDQEDRFREIIRQELVKEFEIGKQKGLSQEEIDDAVALKRYSLEKKYGIDFSKADGGEMRKGVGSLSEIARRMNEGGEVFIPTQEDLDDLAARVKRLYGFDPVATAIEEGVDPDLALRIMMRESSGDHSKGSDAGAIGLMGLMPITAKDVGVDRTDPLQNFVGGLRYLKKMQKRFGPVDGLAAYNAGPTAVEKYGGIPPFKETQDYVRSILTPHTGVDYENEIQTDAETALMQMPVQPASQATRPRARPAGLAPVFETDFNESLRPLARPEQQQQVVEAVEAAVRPSLQEKYSPEGIEQLLIGTTAEPLLPRQFQQGSLSGVGR